VPDEKFVVDYRTSGTQVMDATGPGRRRATPWRAAPRCTIKPGRAPGSEPLGSATQSRYRRIIVR